LALLFSKGIFEDVIFESKVALFKEVLGKGLPVDVNAVYSSMSDLFARQKAFGNELSTEDIASMYV
jgi:hypothetical protein